MKGQYPLIHKDSASVKRKENVSGNKENLKKSQVPKDPNDLVNFGFLSFCRCMGKDRKFNSQRVRTVAAVSMTLKNGRHRRRQGGNRRNVNHRRRQGGNTGNVPAPTPEIEKIVVEKWFYFRRLYF